MIQARNHLYHDGDTALTGWFAEDTSVPGKKPVVLVAPDWSGRNDFACEKAERLAGLGYAGFALDMYGEGKTGQNDDEKLALMKPFVTDRKLLFRRIRAAVDAVKKIGQVDSSRISAIGFCFGGLCVLDLARGSEDIRGVVSLHGLLMPRDEKSAHIRSSVLALHGHDDPSVPPDQVLAFEKEMTEAKADWQIMIFGGTQHAFTNPRAKDPELGRMYNPASDHRAWIATQNFLKEVFAKEYAFSP